eukprot:TRINITY_DN11892_c0_g2_i2.p1 TRINITY_DN11892_c0_g2~~TRINITY_DN11892_c0_g2_i2.p1  ORF type:complete len:174 (-),score=10.94 TRINITY_DN11892_c0_g2_i2:459-980(-)
MMKTEIPNLGATDDMLSSEARQRSFDPVVGWLSTNASQRRVPSTFTHAVKLHALKVNGVAVSPTKDEEKTSVTRDHGLPRLESPNGLARVTSAKLAALHMGALLASSQRVARVLQILATRISVRATSKEAGFQIGCLRIVMKKSLDGSAVLQREPAARHADCANSKLAGTRSR